MPYAIISLPPGQAFLRLECSYRLLAGSILFLSLLTGCAGIPNHSTATLVKRGDLEVQPLLSGGAVGAGPSSPYLGIRGTYGLTSQVNLSWQGMGNPFEKNSEERLFYQLLEVKKGWVPNRHAFSLGFGFTSKELAHLELRNYNNFSVNPRLIYCVSPALSLSRYPTVDFNSDDSRAPSEKEEYGYWPDFWLHHALEARIGSHLAVRTQIGAGLLALIAGYPAISYGLSAGWVF